MGDILVSSFWQDESAQYLAVSGVALVMWDYCTSFDVEVKYFWNGEWSLSRVLFFLEAKVVIHQWKVLIVCTGLLLSIIQAMHTLRLWYLSARSKPLRIALVLTFLLFVISQMLASIYVVVAFGSPQGLANKDLIRSITIQQKAWLPAVIVHAILYGLCTARTYMRRSGLKDEDAIRDRVLLEGAVFFVVLFGALLICGVGGFDANTTVEIRAVYSNFVTALMSVSMSRLMLSIRSLSVSLGTDPDWLLSHLEMSRLHWTKGARDGELIVEVGVGRTEDEYELQTPSSHGMSRCTTHAP
ncbi:hypothetical protein GLOTRDRAFT_124100 [Gloeophyllum trabeum ATCC 11539]|uniref:DUF6533 domain-containing protein n=1 Tax=Gloeophyllum trabeum (strain ATCC 11539 / FP-39264 / Madison 617) TaxID=670483 RepID=S7QLP4_GLOTA|nr:uncharacterized protein GLOTRDRAFT_124100 [Gloeophyllum trabeum ATCC 11539]EPQ60343.1 hypothetical protein GLOTRDRAFT_124100 [Gloeophyllum trabeum ATCC 11539]